MEVVPFEPGHLKALDLQAAQAFMGDLVGDWEQYGELLALPGLAFTGIGGDGIVGCAGVWPLHPGCGQAWTLMSKIFPKYKLPATREIRKFLERTLDGKRFWRIQTPVRADFAPGRRWAQALGFREEGYMKKYGPEGADYLLYARVV